MKSSFKPLIAALALIAPLASNAATNLLVNGSFENPGVAADSVAIACCPSSCNIDIGPIPHPGLFVPIICTLT